MAKVGYVTDLRMADHKGPDIHPEHPARLTGVVQRLESLAEDMVRV